MGNVRMRAEQIDYGATNVKAALDDLDVSDLLKLNARMNKIDAWKDTVEETELTGNPVIYQNALAVPAKSLKTTIEPIQDLHGYDHPWAGGAYKNKLPMTVASIKAANTSGTWSGNTYTRNGVDFSILTDNDNNVIGINVNTPSSASNSAYFTIAPDINLPEGNYVKNGCPSGGSGTTYLLGGTNTGNDIGSGTSFTVESGSSYSVLIAIISGTTISNKVFYPMIRLATESDASFAPYSNVCPISGRTEVRVDTENEDSSESAYATIQLGQTVYGAEVDFDTGVVEVTDGYIASYDGETLPSTWISDRDVYAAGTTPSTGAEVVYKLATPATIQLTPAQLEMLKGYNRVSIDNGAITIKAYTGAAWGGDET